jgi:hypothetical protein
MSRRFAVLLDGGFVWRRLGLRLGRPLKRDLKAHVDVVL